MSDNQNLPTEYQAHLPGAPMPGYPDAAYGMEEEEGGGDGLKRLLAALLRYKWLVLGITLVGTTVAALIGRRLPNTYQVETKFYFNETKPNNPYDVADLFKDDAWMQVMNSYLVQDWVASERGLYLKHEEGDGIFKGFRVDTTFVPGTYKMTVGNDYMVELRNKTGQLVESVPAGNPVGRKYGFIWTPRKALLTPGREVNFEVLTYRDASKELAKDLNVSMPNDAFMVVTLKGEDPTVIANILNTMATRFLEVATNLKKAQLVQVRDVLAEQLNTAKAALDDSEGTLYDYQVATITEPSVTASPIAPGLTATEAPVMKRYLELETARRLLQQERGAVQRVLSNAGSDSMSVDAMASIGSISRAPELAQELKNLADLRSQKRALLIDHQPGHELVVAVQERIDALQNNTIPMLGQSVLSDLNARVSSLDSLIAVTEPELLGIPERTITEGKLKRNVSLSESMFSSLQSSYEAARIAAETSVPDVQLMDPARPGGAPSSNPLVMFLLMGFAGSLGLGIALAIVIDRLDPRIQYAAQVTRDLRLSVIGVVPTLVSRNGKPVAADANAKVVEALRGIRLNLMHAFGTAGPITLTVSSPGSGDGKTFISSNLALAFSDLGMRTLVIDGDTRRGELHRLYDATRKPGLTDYLGGVASLEEVIRTTRFPLVNIIPAGTRRPDAPELLSTPRMGDMLAHIRSRYQVILIDSPPLGAGIDPLVLATLTGHLVLIMRTGKTDRTLAGAKLEMLDRLPIRVLGAIINGLDTHDAYRYYSYLPGYEAGSEELLAAPEGEPGDQASEDQDETRVLESV